MATDPDLRSIHLGLRGIWLPPANAGCDERSLRLVDAPDPARHEPGGVSPFDVHGVVIEEQHTGGRHWDGSRAGDE